MSNPDDPLKLRLAPLESTDDLARRLERERVLRTRQQESDLEEVPLAPMRVGSVPYLNAVPLTRASRIRLSSPRHRALPNCCARTSWMRRW